MSRERILTPSLARDLVHVLTEDRLVAYFGILLGLFLMLIDLGYGRVEVKPGPVALTVAATLIYLVFRISARVVCRRHGLRIVEPEVTVRGRLNYWSALIWGAVLMVTGGLTGTPLVTTIGLIPISVVLVLAALGAVFLKLGAVERPWSIAALEPDDTTS